MEFVPLDIPEVILVKPKLHKDERGYFSETWKQSAFKVAGITDNFAQDNQSLSLDVGTVRGLHYQLLPHGQAKLVKCLKGAILDVAVDIRRSSPTFGKYVSAELTETNLHQLYLPIGFAHGFVTLERNTLVTYKVSSEYAPESERSIHWKDPEIAIDWGLSASSAKLSKKDDDAPPLSKVDVFD